MGASTSKLERALVDLPDGEKYFGLENFGNTCYCNSVLQALYFCKPFRERLLQYAAAGGHNGEENLLTAIADLFVQISTQKRKTGVIQPKRFVQRLKRDNELFRTCQHQDAHEFLNFLLNEINDVLEKEQRERGGRGGSGRSSAGGLGGGGGHPSGSAAAGGRGARALSSAASNAGLGGASPSVVGGGQAAAGAAQQGRPGQGQQQQRKTWVQDLFQGRWVNETRCLRCETVTSREETWFEWSLEIEPNSSVTSCLRNFSSTETLDAENKFFCDACGCLQEAQKRVKCKELPRVLCLHLKRFYIENIGRMRKLTYRVVFPFDLKLSNTTEECPGADSTYSLFGVVVHVGGGIHHGHYVSLVKSADSWVFFDDENVEPISEAMVQTTFGSTSDYNNNMDHGYILLYEQQPPENSLTKQQQQQQDGAAQGVSIGSPLKAQPPQQQQQGGMFRHGSGVFGNGGSGGFGFGSSSTTTPMDS